MGYFFDHKIHEIDGDIVTALRKLPDSSGGLSRILLPTLFDITKWRRMYIKEWGRRWYSKSKRCVMIYRLNTLINGVYEIVTYDITLLSSRMNGYSARYFRMQDGEIILLDNMAQVNDWLRSDRGNLEYLIGDIRNKHGYSFREIDHLLDTGQISKERAESMREFRKVSEAAYAIEK